MSRRLLATLASAIVLALVAGLFSCTVMNGLQVTLKPDGSVGRSNRGDDDDGTVEPDGGTPDGATGPAVRCDLGTPFASFTPLNELNTAGDEELPRVTRDELSIFYFNDDLVDGGTLMHHAERPSASVPFGTPTPFLPELPGARQASPSSDPLRLYYAQGNDAFDLHLAQRATVNDAFTPGRIVLAASQNESLAYPALYDGPKGLRIVFIKTLFDGQNDHSDIWTADVDTSGTVVNPGPLDALNTADTEFDPTPSTDGLAMYFYSEHTLPVDRGRIWLAQRASADDTFGAPAIVAEIAPPPNGYVSPSSLSVDRCRLYYYQAQQSDGPADLFVATRVPLSP